MNWLPLAGIAVVVLGFALRLNAALVVVLAGVVTGFAAGMSAQEVLAAFGEGFRNNRFLALFVLMLPLLGLLERFGLREHAAGWVARRPRMGVFRVLLSYLALRQVTAALGLVSLGGQAQTVRPLLAPMAEAAARETCGTLIQSVYAGHGIVLDPLDIALWGLPTALCAFLIHALRLRRFSRRWQR